MERPFLVPQKTAPKTILRHAIRVEHHWRSLPPGLELAQAAVLVSGLAMALARTWQINHAQNHHKNDHGSTHVTNYCRPNIDHHNWTKFNIDHHDCTKFNIDHYQHHHYHHH